MHVAKIQNTFVILESEHSIMTAKLNVIIIQWRTWEGSRGCL